MRPRQLYSRVSQYDSHSRSNSALFWLVWGIVDDWLFLTIDRGSEQVEIVSFLFETLILSEFGGSDGTLIIDADLAKLSSSSVVQFRWKWTLWPGIGVGGVDKGVEFSKRFTLNIWNKISFWHTYSLWFKYVENFYFSSFEFR